MHPRFLQLTLLVFLGLILAVLIPFVDQAAREIGERPAERFFAVGGRSAPEPTTTPVDPRELEAVRSQNLKEAAVRSRFEQTFWQNYQSYVQAKERILEVWRRDPRRVDGDVLSLQELERGIVSSVKNQFLRSASLVKAGLLAVAAQVENPNVLAFLERIYGATDDSELKTAVLEAVPVAINRVAWQEKRAAYAGVRTFLKALSADHANQLRTEAIHALVANPVLKEDTPFVINLFEARDDQMSDALRAAILEGLSAFLPESRALLFRMAEGDNGMFNGAAIHSLRSAYHKGNGSKETFNAIDEFVKEHPELKSALTPPAAFVAAAPATSLAARPVAPRLALAAAAVVGDEAEPTPLSSPPAKTRSSPAAPSPIPQSQSGDTLPLITPTVPSSVVPSLSLPLPSPSPPPGSAFSCELDQYGRTGYSGTRMSKVRISPSGISSPFGLLFPPATESEEVAGNPPSNSFFAVGEAFPDGRPAPSNWWLGEFSSSLTDEEFALMDSGPQGAHSFTAEIKNPTRNRGTSINSQVQGATNMDDVCLAEPQEETEIAECRGLYLIEEYSDPDSETPGRPGSPSRRRGLTTKFQKKCGNGHRDPQEECGEPDLPQCTAPKICHKCRCVGTISPPWEPLPPHRDFVVPGEPSTQPGSGTGTGDHVYTRRDCSTTRSFQFNSSWQRVGPNMRVRQIGLSCPSHLLTFDGAGSGNVAVHSNTLGSTRSEPFRMPSDTDRDGLTDSFELLLNFQRRAGTPAYNLCSANSFPGASDAARDDDVSFWEQRGTRNATWFQDARGDGFSNFEEQRGGIYADALKTEFEGNWYREVTPFNQMITEVSTADPERARSTNPTGLFNPFAEPGIKQLFIVDSLNRYVQSLYYRRIYPPLALSFWKEAGVQAIRLYPADMGGDPSFSIVSFGIRFFDLGRTVNFNSQESSQPHASPQAAVRYRDAFDYELVPLSRGSSFLMATLAGIDGLGVNDVRSGGNAYSLPILVSKEAFLNTMVRRFRLLGPIPIFLQLFDEATESIVLHEAVHKLMRIFHDEGRYSSFTNPPYEPQELIQSFVDQIPPEERRRDTVHIFERTLPGPSPSGFRFEYFAGMWAKGESFSTDPGSLRWVEDQKVHPGLRVDPVSGFELFIPQEYMNSVPERRVWPYIRLEALHVYQMRLPPEPFPGFGDPPVGPLYSPVQLGSGYFGALFNRWPIIARGYSSPPASDMSLDLNGFGGWFSDIAQSILNAKTVQMKNIDYQKVDLAGPPSWNPHSPRVPPP